MAQHLSPPALRAAALLRAAFERAVGGLTGGSERNAAAHSGPARDPAPEQGQIAAVCARALMQRALASLGGGARAVAQGVGLREEVPQAVAP